MGEKTMLEVSTIIPTLFPSTDLCLQQFIPFPINSEVSGDKIEKNEIGRACSAYGGEERRIQGFGGETSGKETTWKTQA